MVGSRTVTRGYQLPFSSVFPTFRPIPPSTVLHNWVNGFNGSALDSESGKTARYWRSPRRHLACQCEAVSNFAWYRAYNYFCPIRPRTYMSAQSDELTSTLNDPNVTDRRGVTVAQWRARTYSGNPEQLQIVTRKFWPHLRSVPALYIHVLYSGGAIITDAFRSRLICVASVGNFEIGLYFASVVDNESAKSIGRNPFGNSRLVVVRVTLRISRK